MKSIGVPKCTLFVLAIILAVITSSASARVRDRLKTNEQKETKGGRREGKGNRAHI